MNKECFDEETSALIDRVSDGRDVDGFKNYMRKKVRQMHFFIL